MTRRPSKLNEHTEATIVNAIKVGAPYEIAARGAGVTYQTLRNWMKWGEAESDEPEDERGPCFALFEAVEKAKHNAYVRALVVIHKAAQDGTWQAAAWFLERKDPDNWARRERDMNADDSPEDKAEQVRLAVEQMRNTVPVNDESST